MQILDNDHIPLASIEFLLHNIWLLLGFPLSEAKGLKVEANARNFNEIEL